MTNFETTQKRITEMARVLDNFGKAYKNKGISSGAEIEAQYKAKANEYNNELNENYGPFSTPFFTTNIELYTRLREFDNWR